VCIYIYSISPYLFYGFEQARKINMVTHTHTHTHTHSYTQTLYI